MPWQKNQSGNPKGRKPLSEQEKLVRKNFYDSLKQATPEALETILEIMHDPKALNRDRISCARVILDKAYGSVPLLANSNDDTKLEITIIRGIETTADNISDVEWEEAISEFS